MEQDAAAPDPETIKFALLYAELFVAIKAVQPLDQAVFLRIVDALAAYCEEMVQMLRPAEVAR